MQGGRQVRPPEKGEYHLSLRFQLCMCVLGERSRKSKRDRAREDASGFPQPPGGVSLHHLQGVSWATGICAAVLLISHSHTPHWTPERERAPSSLLESLASRSRCCCHKYLLQSFESLKPFLGPAAEKGTLTMANCL